MITTFNLVGLMYGDGHITIFPEAYDSITQGNWAIAMSASQLTGSYFLNATGPAQNDRINYKAWLQAGTYTLVLVGFTSTDQGIITLLIDGSASGTMDMYAIGANYNQIKTIAGINIATSGLKQIGLKMATKNGASSSYYGAYSIIALYRTA